MNSLDSYPDILRATRRLLDKANAWGRFPTPVEDIIAVAGLVEPDDSVLSDTVIQRAPRHLANIFRKLSGRIRGLLDRKTREIHLDPLVGYEPKRRFIRLHETVHHVLPWQRALGYADDDETLALHVRRKFERESNQGAAELLFQHERFAEETHDLELGLGAVGFMANRYGASLRSALRRYVEGHRGTLIGLVLEPSPLQIKPLQYRRYELIVSERFSKRFGQPHWPRVLQIEDYPFLAEAGAAGGQLRTVVAGEWQITDLRKDSSIIRFETMHTGYNILLLAWLPQRTWLKRKVILTSDMRGIGPSAA